MNRSIAITKLYSLLYLFEDIGYNKNKLAEVLSMNIEDFSQPDYNFSSKQIILLFKLASTLTINPLFGLNYGTRLTKSFSSVLGVLISSCRNLNEALYYFCKYEEVVDRTSMTTYKLFPKSIEVKMTFYNDDTVIPVEYIEYKVAGFITYLQNIIREDFVPSLEVEFSHHPLCDTSLYKDILGCSVSFNNKNLIIRLPNNIMEKLIEEPNNLLKNIMINEAEKIVQSYKKLNSFTDMVKEFIISAPGNYIPTLAEVSQNLTISERQLQKYLKNEGTSFTSIINRYKKENALSYLKNPMNTIDEIAYILGFSERSSFDRAFKRWTNKSPIEYRAEI